MYIGTHISIRHGYSAAAKTAVGLGMRAYQFFSKNPRSLSVKSFDVGDAANCLRLHNEHGLRTIVHAPYPVNLASEDEDLRSAMIRSLRNDLEICEACGAFGLVVHFGKFRGDMLQGYQRIIRMLNEVLREWQGETKILLENQAGEGHRIGTTFEELVQIRKLSAYPEKIGFCFDTCHAFASGLWNGHNSQELLQKGAQLQYWDHLGAIHLNDSVYPTSSGKDRHAPLGVGEIGWESFRSLLEDPIFRQIPHILETPEKNKFTHAQQISQYLRIFE